jgi:F0F1-type ATP synthase assembly protein I
LTGPTGDDAQRRQAARRQGIAYQGASEAAFAILIAMGIGYWIDRHFETSPLYLLIGTGIGFGAFVLRLVRLGRQMSRLPDDAAGPPERPER